MRTIFFVSRALALIGIGLAACLCRAQTPPEPLKHTFDLSFSYTYLHANAPPGGCGCFGMHGGSASGALFVRKDLAVVADFGGTHANNILNSTEYLTLFTYLVGVRYSPQKIQSRHADPFIQAMIGGAHTSSQFAFNNNGNGAAVLGGGGIDFPVGRHFSIRAAEADYLYTHVPNGSNNSQNSFRLTSGIVIRLP